VIPSNIITTCLLIKPKWTDDVFWARLHPGPPPVNVDMQQWKAINKSLWSKCFFDVQSNPGHILNVIFLVCLAKLYPAFLLPKTIYIYIYCVYAIKRSPAKTAAGRLIKRVGYMNSWIKCVAAWENQSHGQNVRNGSYLSTESLWIKDEDTV
jgi:hypothetical protein